MRERLKLIIQVALFVIVLIAVVTALTIWSDPVPVRCFRC